MASKRPLRTSAFGKRNNPLRHGRASTLRGAVLSATKRLLYQPQIFVIEIMDPDERLLALVRRTWFSGVSAEFQSRAKKWLRKS